MEKELSYVSNIAESIPRANYLSKMETRPKITKDERAKDAIHAIGARKFSIQPRSPDIKPIENIFHQVKRKLNSDALENHIEHENFENFSKRVKQTMEDFPKDVIDKTIESMNKRIGLIIKCKGQRTKY